MRMPAVQRDWTAERVRELIDETRHWPRYEVIDGELLVTPAPEPPHQAAVLALAVLLRPYTKSTGVGTTMISPADIEFSPRRMVQPDVFVVLPTADGRRIGSWRDVPGLLLAVEVLSPSSARSDRQLKRRLYQSEGVGEYWVIDLDGRVVERWRPEDERPEVLDTTLVWQPSAEHAPLVIELGAFFEEIVGE